MMKLLNAIVDQAATDEDLGEDDLGLCVVRTLSS